MTVIAVLGAGKIGEALLSGLLHGGHEPGDLLFTERYPARVEELTARYGIRGVEVEEAAKQADVLVVAVKPQDIDPVLAELAPLLGPSSLVVSLCAGCRPRCTSGGWPRVCPWCGSCRTRRCWSARP